MLPGADLPGEADRAGVAEPGRVDRSDFHPVAAGLELLVDPRRPAGDEATAVEAAAKVGPAGVGVKAEASGPAPRLLRRVATEEGLRGLSLRRHRTWRL